MASQDGAVFTELEGEPGAGQFIARDIVRGPRRIVAKIGDPFTVDVVLAHGQWLEAIDEVLVHSPTDVITSSDRYSVGSPLRLKRPPVAAAPAPESGVNDHVGS